MIDTDEQEPGFFQRHRNAVILGVGCALLGGGLVGKCLVATPEIAQQRQPGPTIFFHPQPTPAATPSATPPVIQPTPTPADSKFVDRTPNIPDNHPVAKSGPVETPGPISTGVRPTGANDGLPGSGPGIGGNGDYSGNPGGGDKFGAFASQVEGSVSDAFHNNPRTRGANLKLTVRLWPDATGRVARARISPRTGNASLDDLIEKQILTGIQLASAPPADMPLPIVMNVTLQRP